MIVRTIEYCLFESNHHFKTIVIIFVIQLLTFSHKVDAKSENVFFRCTLLGFLLWGLNELANLKPDERFYCQKSNYLHVFTLLPFRISYRTPTKDMPSQFEIHIDRIWCLKWRGATEEKYILTIMRGCIPK